MVNLLSLGKVKSRKQVPRSKIDMLNKFWIQNIYMKVK